MDRGPVRNIISGAQAGVDRAALPSASPSAAGAPKASVQKKVPLQTTTPSRNLLSRLPGSEEGYKKMKKNRQELILQVGAAGGSISLWSVGTKDGTRSFVVERDESTLKDLLPEEDTEVIAFKSKTAPLHSFADAMVALGPYRWHLLYPMFVHQDFREPVLAAVMKLGGEKLAHRWQQLLNVRFSVHFI
jgi:hypothetical protein